MSSTCTKSVRGLWGFGCAAVVGGMLASSASAATIWAVDNQDNLFSFDNLTPQTILTGHFISGLQPNEQILAIDFRNASSTPPDLRH